MVLYCVLLYCYVLLYLSCCIVLYCIVLLLTILYRIVVAGFEDDFAEVCIDICDKQLSGMREAKHLMSRDHPVQREISKLLFPVGQSSYFVLFTIIYFSFL